MVFTHSICYDVFINLHLMVLNIFKDYGLMTIPWYIVEYPFIYLLAINGPLVSMWHKKLIHSFIYQVYLLYLYTFGHVCENVAT